MRFMRNAEHGEEGFDDDPMSSVGNLFDIALVFIVALLFALALMYLFDSRVLSLLTSIAGLPEVKQEVNTGE